PFSSLMPRGAHNFATSAPKLSGSGQTVAVALIAISDDLRGFPNWGAHGRSGPFGCKRKVEECLAIADAMIDPGHKDSMFVLAEWWMRLAQHDRVVGHILDAISPEGDELNRSA